MMSIYRADLHVHTSASADGRSSLKEIARAARRAGLDAVAVTDHNLCTPVPERLEGVLFIPGCEVSTRAGHITALFLTRPLPAWPAPPEPEEAVAAIRDCGGLAVLAHPFQHRREMEPLLPLVPSLDGVEVWNSRANRKNPRANQMAADFAQAQGLRPFAGSDAHLPQEIGNGRILVEVEACTLPVLRGALLGGQGQVSGRESRAIWVARSQYTKLRKSNASPLDYGKWALFAAKCAWEDL